MISLRSCIVWEVYTKRRFLVKPQLKSILLKLLVISRFMGERRPWKFDAGVAAAEIAKRREAAPSGDATSA